MPRIKGVLLDEDSDDEPIADGAATDGAAIGGAGPSQAQTTDKGKGILKDPAPRPTKRAKQVNEEELALKRAQDESRLEAQRKRDEDYKLKQAEAQAQALMYARLPLLRLFLLFCPHLKDQLLLQRPLC